MNTDPARPGPRSRAFSAWALKHGRLLWTLALLLAIPAAWRTAKLYLNLRSDLEQLLPRTAPSVLALDELRARTPGLQFLGVLVDAGVAGNLPAAERFLDDLAARVRTYPPELVREVRLGFGEERSFFEKNLPLYLETGDLETVRQRIDERVHHEFMQGSGMLLDDSEPPPLDFSDLERKYQSRMAGTTLTGDRFSRSQPAESLMLIEVGGFSTGNEHAAALMKRVKHDIAALGGTDRYAPGMRIGYTGDVAVVVEEMSALVVDLTFSTVLVIVLVMAALVFYYRWFRSVPVLLAPLLVGAVCAFGLASVAFGVTELNSNTAFLGSIIVGNGINFGIIMLARYVEARRRGSSIEDAMAVSISGTRAGTLSAALAAAAAYASLMAMQFRGFRQFGIIGGLGMLACWGATFLLGPSLMAWLDGGRLGQHPSRPDGLARPMAVLADWIAWRPAPYVLLAAVLSVLAAVQVRHFGHAQLEHDFSRLRRADTWTVGEGYWGARMDAMLGRQVTPTVLLADDVAQARRLAARLRDAMTRSPLKEMISSVLTEDDVVPPEQARKQEIVEGIRHKLTPALLSHVDAERREQILRFLGAGPLGLVRVDDVPRGLTSALRERDGTMGRTILVFPSPSKALWQGPAIARFVDALRAIAAAEPGPSGRPARVAGSPPLTADVLSSMTHDGPLASLLAFIGVVATVFVLFRFGIATPFVLGSLIVGVLWMLAATMFLGIKINFVSFIAFPITFGIGVDYAVNVMGRYLQDGRADVTAAIRATGGAVGLASATTIIGYSSLLLAQNRGLFNFGVLAVIGELTCVTTAVIVLPAALLLYQEWRARRIP